ncbi:hypothetical protein [Kander virus]|uniref:Phosphoprotein n=1 Tax=Kander virus TaxID=2883639 RepID=A0ABY3P9H2_9MONO|nr:hypothetical protein QKS96_gp2 [Kander virus]UCU83237.1 hypothetical protein [Kander virus]
MASDKQSIEAMANRILADRDLQILGGLLDGIDDEKYDPTEVPRPPGCGDLSDISTFRDMFGYVSSADLLNSLCASSYKKDLEESIKKAGSTLSALMQKAPKDGNVNSFMRGYSKICSDTGTEHSVHLGAEPGQPEEPKPIAPTPGPKKQEKKGKEETETPKPRPKKEEGPAEKPAAAVKPKTDPKAGISLSGDPNVVASIHGGTDQQGASSLTTIEEEAPKGKPVAPPRPPPQGDQQPDTRGLPARPNFYQKMLEGGPDVGTRYLDAVVMGELKMDGRAIEDLLDDMEKVADDPDEGSIRVLMEGSIRKEVELPAAADYPASARHLFNRWARSGTVGATNYIVRRIFSEYCDVVEQIVEESNTRQDRRAAESLDGETLGGVMSAMMTKIDESLSLVRNENAELKRKVSELASTVEHMTLIMTDLSAKLQTACVSTSSYPKAKDLATGLRQPTDPRSSDSWQAGATSWGRREGMIWSGAVGKDRLEGEGGFTGEEADDILKQVENQWSAEGENPLGFGTSARNRQEREEVLEGLMGTGYRGKYAESEVKLRKYNF